MKVLRSNHPYEMAFKVQQGRETITVTLPKKRYKTFAHRQLGKINFVELTDDQVAILEANVTFRSMLARGDYSWAKEIPSHAMPLSAQLKAERTARVKAEA